MSQFHMLLSFQAPFGGEEFFLWWMFIEQLQDVKWGMGDQFFFGLIFGLILS
jgi:hypothetical protein